jgi:hypothetical protein
MTKTIEVVVHPDGSIKFETKGFNGASCREASAYLEQALGARSSEKLTSDFYSQAAEHQNLRQEG